MIKYRTTQILRLVGGRIGLDERQAKVRMTCLRRIDKDLYEIVAPVEFKVGEIVGLEELPKTANPFVTAVEKKQAESLGRTAVKPAAKKDAK